MAEELALCQGGRESGDVDGEEEGVGFVGEGEGAFVKGLETAGGYCFGYDFFAGA